MLTATNLVKTYRVYQKKTGLLGAVKGLFNREYKEVRAVDGVSFHVDPGEMVAFLGPNGAGSSRWSWARRTSSGGTSPPPTASNSTARSTPWTAPTAIAPSPS